MKKIFLSAILAGAVIAFGGTVFLSVENTVVGSLFFTIGLSSSARAAASVHRQGLLRVR